MDGNVFLATFRGVYVVRLVSFYRFRSARPSEYFLRDEGVLFLGSWRVSTFALRCRLFRFVHEARGSREVLFDGFHERSHSLHRVGLYAARRLTRKYDDSGRGYVFFCEYR